MQAHPTDLEGVLLLTPSLFADDRGFFQESWNQKLWLQLLESQGQPVTTFVQDNHSRSIKGVLRGLHYQISPQPQGKLVRCVRGCIHDVAVDLRRSSATFGQSIGFELNEDNQHQLWIPAGFAHGFLTISDTADVLYKTTHYWSADCERSICWDDSQLAIPWPLERIAPACVSLSPKDSRAPSWQQREDHDWF